MMSVGPGRVGTPLGTRRGTLIAAGAGLLYPLLAIPSGLLTDELAIPSRTSSPEAISAFYSGVSDDAAFMVGMAMLATAYLLLLAFVAKLADLLGTVDGGSTWVRSLIVGLAVVDVTLVFGFIASYATAVFWVQDQEGKPFELSRLPRLRGMIEKTLKGQIVAKEAFVDKDRLKKRERPFRVPTVITFDNEGSDIYTIIEVDTRDRPGLLYDLTRALAAANVYIASAVIATYGEQAVDSFYVKDMFGLGVFLIFYCGFIFFSPNFFGEPDNYIPANPLVTPPHIVPEWYLLPFYAILRSITFDIWFLEAKLLGVLAMFAAIGVLFLLPWLDRSPVRSARFRPIYKQFFWVLLIDCVILAIVGARSPDEPVFSGLPWFQYVALGQIATTYYFFHFLILLPLLSIFERPLPLPASISQPVLKGGGLAAGATARPMEKA